MEKAIESANPLGEWNFGTSNFFACSDFLQHMSCSRSKGQKSKGDAGDLNRTRARKTKISTDVFSGQRLFRTAAQHLTDGALSTVHPRVSASRMKHENDKKTLK
jgi:hypothetical protein